MSCPTNFSLSFTLVGNSPPKDSHKLKESLSKSKEIGK
jgi:hypothetical protein